MIFKIKNFFQKEDTHLLALGKLLSNQQIHSESRNLNDYEFKIFSQWGDDGIIQYLIKNIQIENNTFIEFGVEDYQESNTRFLLMNNNWSGFVMDGSSENMNKLKARKWYWKYALNCKDVFITKENINELMKLAGFKNVGILHIDLDGNDYHILENMELAELNPSIIIMEYNSVFGSKRAITVPYAEKFRRTDAHYSNLYYGASLPALTYLANSIGYSLVCCNNAGNNAYFIRKDLLNDKVLESSIETSFKESKFREGRDKNGKLTYLSGKDRWQLLKGLPVLNVETKVLEEI